MAKPERTFKIGACSASVFVNNAQGGRQFRSVSLQRRYKQGDNWKSATAFTLDEIPNALAVLHLAMSYIAEQDTTTD